MRNSAVKLVFMQWVVIAVLLIGGSVGAYLLIQKVNELTDENATLSGNDASLRNQVKQYRDQVPSPTPTPVITPQPTTPPSSPTPTPKR